jgi:molybdopterin-binding protein
VKDWYPQRDAGVQYVRRAGSVQEKLQKKVVLPRRSFRLPARSSVSDRATPKKDELLMPRDAALQLRVSFPTIKQWIYKRKIRSVKTAGGHQSEIDRLLFRTRAKTDLARQALIRQVSGRNQLVGRIEEVLVSGLMAEVTISIGNQLITSVITSRSAREMGLKAGQTAAALIKATEVMILRI